MRDSGAEVKSAPAFFSIFNSCREKGRGRYGSGRVAVGSVMSSISDLPRFPAASVDQPDGTPDTAGHVRAAFTVAQVAGELLAFASPIFALLWWIVFFPVMFGLLVFAAGQHERR